MYSGSPRWLQLGELGIAVGKCYILTKYKNVTFNVRPKMAIASKHLLKRFPQTEMCVCKLSNESLELPPNSQFATAQPALNQPCCWSHVWQHSLSTFAETTCAQHKCRLPSLPSAESSPTHQPRLPSLHPTAKQAQEKHWKHCLWLCIWTTREVDPWHGLVGEELLQTVIFIPQTARNLLGVQWSHLQSCTSSCWLSRSCV